MRNLSFARRLLPIVLSAFLGCATARTVIHDTAVACTIVPFATIAPILGDVCLTIEDLTSLIETLSKTKAGEDAAFTLIRKDGSSVEIRVAAADVGQALESLSAARRAALAKEQP